LTLSLMYYMHAQADIILFIACLAVILSTLAVACLFEHRDARHMQAINQLQCS